MNIYVAVHGLGNIGQKALEALSTSEDLVCAGVIRRASSLGDGACLAYGVQEFSNIDELVQKTGKKPAVIVLACPSRDVPKLAAMYLEKGFCTVDSFDIHSEIVSLIESLRPIAEKAGTVAISGAGWDPGTDSVLRALYEAMAPRGTTFTNFGLGRSMGHSVAVRALVGVADATSLTIPIGGGRHSRLVYVLPKPDAEHDTIRKAIAADPYFVHDPLEVRFVSSSAELAAVADNSHGVLMERIGASGTTSNQRFSFDMRIDNPALTSQVLVSAARAATRLAPGSYTLIDVPPVALLPGERMHHVKRLV